MQVLKTLLPRLAEVLAKKEESGSFLMQAEQYFVAIPDVKAAELQVYRCKRVREVNIGSGHVRTDHGITLL